MSDSLRDKIASVYRAHRLTFEGRSSPKCDCGWRSPEEYTTWTDHPEHLADAVIRALGLREEQRELMDGMCGQSINYVTGRVTNHYRAATKQHRYVTEWTTE